MYCQEKCIDDLTDFGNLQKMSASDMLILFFWSLHYGEDMDGRELPYKSSHQLGNIISAKHINEFIKILAEQLSSQMADNEEAAEGDVKKKRFFSLK